jgi:hypothetical protein
MKTNRQRFIKFISAIIIIMISLSPITGVRVRADKKQENMSENTTNIETMEKSGEAKHLPGGKECFSKDVKNLVLCVDVIHVII